MSDLRKLCKDVGLSYSRKQDKAELINLIVEYEAKAVTVSIDSAQLAMDQLDPVIALDPTISLAVSRQVEAVTALHSWIGVALTDQQRVYVRLLALKAMIPRLLLKFAQGIRSKAGVG